LASRCNWLNYILDRTLIGKKSKTPSENQNIFLSKNKNKYSIGNNIIFVSYKINKFNVFNEAI